VTAKLNFQHHYSSCLCYIIRWSFRNHC